jgi:hypothetical protein
MDVRISSRHFGTRPGGSKTRHVNFCPLPMTACDGRAGTQAG